MKKIILLIAVSIMAGCSTFDQSVRPKVAAVYDRALESAETTICNDASVGSVKRRYWGSKERAREWANICFSDFTLMDVVTDE